MKEIYIGIFIVLVSVFGSIPGYAQRSNGLTVEGDISVEEGSPEGAIIQMYQDGRRLDNYGVPASGRYKVELNYNHKYELIFQREGNFQQKIVVEADVPRAVLATDPKFPPFPVNINLFTEIPGIDKSFSENTVLKIFYSPSVDNFVSELYYNDAQIRRLIDQAIAQANLADKRADYMSKLTRAELAELRKEYNQLLEKAGEEYSSEKFLAALDGYKAASKIFPDETFPKDRIAEINDLLGLIMAAEELDKAMLERFNTLVKEGDAYLNQTKYSDAKMSYDRALSIKPFDQYVNEQLKRIDELLQRQLLDDKYMDLIAKGDKAIKELLFNEALGQFQQALDIKPNEQYPKTKITEINGLIAAQAKDQEKQKSYDDAIREGERQFSKQFYDRALTAFEKALDYRPGDIKATRRITETREIMKEILDQMAFDNFIAAADRAYKKKDYPEALSNYEEALALYPNDPRAQKRADEISQIIYAERSFAEFVTQADRQFEAQRYANAKALYQKALAINSEDKHARAQITNIDNIVAQQSVDEKYNMAIEQADALLSQNDYENAKGKYDEALSIKPKESYPKDKLADIAAALTAMAKANRDYQEAIENADRFFRDKRYDDAKTAFADAGRIKPGENYPQQMMDRIDGLLEEEARLTAEAAAAEAARLAAIQAEKDKNYADALARADKLFDEKDYEGSRNEYRVAMDVKPEEAYPQERMDEIGTLLAQLSAAQKAYEEAVARGDQEYRREGWDEAIVAYNEAKAAKADESYPDEQITKIDSIREERARLAAEAAAAETARLAAIQAEKDKNYADALARADKLFDEKDYENARKEYQTAQTLKPEEINPSQKITEIDGIIRELEAADAAQAELDRNYANQILQADRHFGAKNYTSAKDNYQKASDLKPGENYPKDKLIEIDEILAQQAQNEKYRTIIVAADGMFRTQKYTDSRLQYEIALGVKPDEQYPRSQILKIDDILNQEQQQILAEQAATEDLENRRADLTKMKEELDEQKILAESGLNALYDQLILKADAFFEDKQYNVSRAWYFKARDLKPEESYPPERIDEINRILSSMMLSQRDREYQRFIDLGDDNFRENELAVARGWYNQALGQKDEQYPKDQLTEIQKRVAERVAGQSEQLFSNYKASGNMAFESGDYIVARFWYKKALELRPNDTESKTRLLEIAEKLK